MDRESTGLPDQMTMSQMTMSQMSEHRVRSLAILAAGTVIPAMPLVLDEHRRFNEKGQRRLIRYYLSAGAGGLAVAVHTTQFEIRLPEIGLFETVLEVAADEIKRFEERTDRTVVRVAGVCGPAGQAVREAGLAARLGYDAALLSPGGLNGFSEDDLVDRTKQVTGIMPVIGFYLQPAVGGRIFTFDYWQRICAVEGVVAIKCASFNRYLTLDVMRAVALSSRSERIAMYTGNDDNIFADLMTEYAVEQDGHIFRSRFVGGLLGHWAVWTHTAVRLFGQLKAARQGSPASEAELDWLTLAAQVTDSNSAIFDAANQFKGCITGIHEVLRRQGLLAGIWTLNPDEKLSPEQYQEIDRVYRQYPHLNDDAFVRDFLAGEQNRPAQSDPDNPETPDK